MLVSMSDSTARPDWKTIGGTAVVFAVTGLIVWWVVLDMKDVAPWCALAMGAAGALIATVLEMVSVRNRGR
jgi:dolichol kinase